MRQPRRQLALPIAMRIEPTEAMLRAAHAACGLRLPFEEAMASPTGLAKVLAMLARRQGPARRRGR